jgi:hypothetical protein
MEPDDRTVAQLAVFESGVTGQGVIGRLHFGHICRICRLVGSGRLTAEEGERVLLYFVAAVDTLDTESETDREPEGDGAGSGAAAPLEAARRRRMRKLVPGCPFGPQE